MSAPAAPSLFNFNNYKDFLRAKIAENAALRGYQSKLAEAARCQRSFLSQVLKAGKFEISKDQAMGLAVFWDFDSLETEYLLTLVDLNRSASAELKAHLTKKLRSLASERQNLSKRIADAETQSSEMEMNYFSSWHVGAVHMLCLVPEYQNLESLQKRLGLPRPVLQDTLRQLEKLGLVTKHGAQWTSVLKSIHLPTQSVMSAPYQTSWRHRAVADLPKQNPDSLHYTSVFSASRKDARLMREMLVECTLKIRERIGPSRDEETFCMSTDFFEV